MRLGLSLGYAPPGTNPTELIKLAQKAEGLGYDSAWAAEAWGTDVVSVLSWLAATTTKVTVTIAAAALGRRSQPAVGLAPAARSSPTHACMSR